MMQLVYCDCGESSMLEGRCIGCKRVRPSSSEVLEQLNKNHDHEKDLLKELEIALNLEGEI